MHVQDGKAFMQLETVKKKILETECYYSELQLEENGFGSGADFHRMPGEMTLESLLGEKKFQKLRKVILKFFGIDPILFNRYYPMLVINAIQATILSRNSEVILDLYLHRFAAENGKELRFLESMEEQKSIFYRIPLELQTRALLSLGRQPSKMRKQIRDMLEDYAAEESRMLYQRSRKQLGKLRHILLYDRNVRMAETLQTDLREKSAFVGVGAAHLFGYKGILRLLKKEGFRVRPVRTQE